MIDLKLTDVRPFIGSRDFEVSKAFYEALGWTTEYLDDQLALMVNGAHGFYLQRYYQKDWLENTMLHLTVADATACHAQIAEVLASGAYGEARVAPPKQEDYGALVTYVWDPAGVLLHLAQWSDA
jgi:predicted enzyme related to lactoylglutathione lyase